MEMTAHVPQPFLLSCPSRHQFAATMDPLRVQGLPHRLAVLVAAVQELLSERGELADNLELACADLEIARDAMRGVLRHLEAGRVRWAKEMLEEAIDDASDALDSLKG